MTTATAAQQLEKNQAKRTAETATWAQSRQEHREEEYSGTCSEMQGKPMQKMAKKMVGGEAKPQGCSQGSGTETLVLQNEKKLHEGPHLQRELAHLCS